MPKQTDSSGNLTTRPSDPVDGKVPTEKEVARFHTNADTDGDSGSIHHTLGPRKGQATEGDHDHRGGNSVALLQGVTVSGSRATDAWRTSVMALLVELGATDSTTP